MEEDKTNISKKPEKRKMTEKQKVARLANLEKGRKIRLDTVKNKKESKAEEYHFSSEESNDSTDSETDEDAFIISRKKKPLTKTKIDTKSTKQTKKKGNGLNKYDENYDNFVKKDDFNELKNAVEFIVNEQKKQNKAVKKATKKTKKSSGRTNIVINPPQNPSNSQKSLANNTYYESLVKSIMD